MSGQQEGDNIMMLQLKTNLCNPITSTGGTNRIDIQKSNPPSLETLCNPLQHITSDWSLEQHQHAWTWLQRWTPKFNPAATSTYLHCLVFSNRTHGAPLASIPFLSDLFGHSTSAALSQISLAFLPLPDCRASKKSSEMKCRRCSAECPAINSLAAADGRTYSCNRHHLTSAIS